MQASSIKDRETLQNWLSTRPEADSVAIAQRGALRIAPLWFSAMALDWARKNDLTALPVLRLILTSGVATTDKSPEIASALDAADEAALKASYAAETSAESDAKTAESFAAAGTATDAVAAARLIVHALTIASPANALLSHASAYCAATIVSALECWGVARSEGLQLEQGNSLNGVGLWQDMENPLGAAWQSTKDLWAEQGDAFGFWARWYEAGLNGQILNPALEREIALIPDPDWELGPKYISAIIAQKEARYNRKALSGRAYP